MSISKTPDASGLGSIISGEGWATRIHKSNDPLNPWFAITDQRSGEKLARGLGDTKEYIDTLLPSWMRSQDRK